MGAPKGLIGAALFVVASLVGGPGTVAAAPPAAVSSTPTPSGILALPSPTPTYCVAEWAWLRRELPAEAVAGVPLIVHYDWMGGTATIRRMEETVPAGWQVLSPPWSERSGDTYVWGAFSPFGSPPQIEVLPPVGLPSGDYQFSGRTTSWHSCNGEVSRYIEGDWRINLRAATVPCVGDCVGDGMVTVDDVMKAVSIALGEAGVDMCSAAEPNGDGTVTVDEILTAVQSALQGCPE